MDVTAYTDGECLGTFYDVAPPIDLTQNKVVSEMAIEDRLGGRPPMEPPSTRQNAEFTEFIGVDDDDDGEVENHPPD